VAAVTDDPGRYLTRRDSADGPVWELRLPARQFPVAAAALRVAEVATVSCRWTAPEVHAYVVASTHAAALEAVAALQRRGVELVEPTG
jgi:hypothetical protein